MKHITRRQFLKSGSALIALPMFESLMPAKAFAQTIVNAPTRLVVMYFPMGCYYNSWMPAVSGTNFTLPAQLTSLERHKSDLVITTGLKNTLLGVGGDHAKAASSFMTGVPIKNDFSVGPSIDKLIADKLNQAANNRWLVLAPPGDGGADVIPAAYTSNISWISPTQPAARLTDTASVFNTLFPTTGNQPVNAIAKRQFYRKSILDEALSQGTALKAKLGSYDQQKLDQYLTGVREVELSLSSTAPSLTTCNPGTNPGSTANDFAKFTKTMIDLVVLSLQCDRSRIVSHFLDFENTYRVGVAGVQQAHHVVSHYDTNRAVYIQQYQQISAWYAQQFGYFLDKMKAVRPEDPNKTLLDSSLVVFGSDIHDGQMHGHDNLPIILAGKANGALTTGRVLSTSAPLSNLWVSVAQKAGATSITSHGNSTGTLAGL